MKYPSLTVFCIVGLHSLVDSDSGQSDLDVAASVRSCSTKDIEKVSLLDIMQVLV